MKFILLFLFAAVQTFAATLTLEAQRRDIASGAPMTERVEIDTSKVGIIVVDMWNFHWCKTSTARVGALVPRMNRCLEELRKMGAQVFLCPTDVADNYVGTRMIESVLAVEPMPIPKARKIECPAAADGGGCTCGPGNRCLVNYGWDGMHPDLIVGESDLMPNDPEMLYAILKKRGITHLIFMGVHTQVCLLGKSIGMRNMLEAGFQCYLCRDLTDAHGMYDPVKGITPDAFTRGVVAHFEKYLAPSINMVDTLRAAKLWDENAIVDPVRVAPWGTVKRPHHFEKSVVVTLSAPWEPEAKIHYTLDGSEPTVSSPTYTAPLTFEKTTRVRTCAFANGKPVALATDAFFARQNPEPPQPNIILSSLKPRRAVGPGHSPSFSDHRFSPISNPPQMNLSNRKEALRIRGKKYDSGIGVQAPNQLIYDLKPEYARFVALAGIDDHILDVSNGSNLAMHPSVIFRVFIDGEMAAESPVMRISEPAWRFDVPIPSGSKMISLVATDAGDGNKEDLGNWVDCGFVTK
jgi:hypothetical protein